MKRLGTREAVSGEAREELIRVAREQLTKAQEATACRDAAVARMLARTRNADPLGGVQKKREGSDRRPEPFEGAADNRVRWADFAVECTLSLILESLSTAELRVIPVGGSDGEEERAFALTKLAKWCLGRLGGQWQEQLELAVRYALTDSPALGGVLVSWEKRAVKAPRVITLEEAVSAVLKSDETLSAEEAIRLVRGGGEAPEMVSALDLDGVVQSLVGAFGIGEALAKKVLRAFRGGEDEVEVLATVDWDEGPRVKALRYYDDFLIPSRCEDVAFASPWFRSAWLTEAQLRAQAQEHGWSEQWVEETLGHEGEELVSFGGCSVSRDELSGLYQVITAYEAQTDEDGVVLRWQTVLSCAEGTACGRELLRGNKGGYPCVVFRRERLSPRLLESRGIAEVAAPEMETAKALSDGAANNALVGGLPPVLARNVRGRVSLRSLDVVRLTGANSEVKFMQPPAYPAQANGEVARLRAGVYEYLGLATADGDKDMLGVRRRKLVKTWMENLQELLGAMLSLAQSEASDGCLAMVLGRAGMDGNVRQDVSGAFRLRLEVNPEDLFARNVIEKTQALGQILGTLDRAKAVDTTPLALRATRVLFPDISDEMMQSPNALNDREISAEEENYVKIRSGLKPKMDTEGRWDYAARLAFWQKLEQENPEALAEMPEASAEFAKQWVQALQQQAEQFGENAALGRTGSAQVQPMA